MSHVRKLGAPCLDGWHAHSSSDPPYSLGEVAQAIASVKPGRGCLVAPGAAIRARSAMGRQLTACLVSFGRHVGLTSTHWAHRRFAPVRKGGPLTVTRTKYLRPVSFGADMAQIQDALWVQRNSSLLMQFCGHGQVGGVSDAPSAVAALVVHAELRNYQGLATYWASSDMRWGFDVATFAAMLFTAYQAGVTRVDWLLLDDIMAMDSQHVELNNLASDHFFLGCGVAQGRRFSIPVFNGMMRWLADEIEIVSPGGTRAWLPPFAMAALQSAHAI